MGRYEEKRKSISGMPQNPLEAGRISERRRRRRTSNRATLVTGIMIGACITGLLCKSMRQVSDKRNERKVK